MSVLMGSVTCESLVALAMVGDSVSELWFEGGDR